MTRNKANKSSTKEYSEQTLFFHKRVYLTGDLTCGSYSSLVLLHALGLADCTAYIC